jgi:hypothetical protein
MRGKGTSVAGYARRLFELFVKPSAMSAICAYETAGIDVKRTCLDGAR